MYGRLFLSGAVAFVLSVNPALAQREGPGYIDRQKPPPPPPPVRPPVAQLPPVQPNENRQTFYSPPHWSGEGSNWSGWYTFETPPAPPGYVYYSETHQLEGDRWCGAWAICELTGQTPDGRVHFGLGCRVMMKMLFI